MYVIRSIPSASPAELPASIPGELTVYSDYALFVPGTYPHDPHRLTILEPTVHIGQADDDDCVSVNGWVEAEAPDPQQCALWHRVTEVFYPMPRPPRVS